MATYIQGLTQYLPQIQPFQRDFNFFANVMQKKQTEYDSGYQAMNKLYGSIFYSDVSRADNQEKKAEILSAIDHDLRKVSGLDLSLDENVRQAQQVFRPFYEDQNLMKDISYTKTYQSSMQKGLSSKDCVGKDCPDVYWDGGLRLLEHQMKNFKSVSADRAMQMRNPTYVNKFNMMKEAAKAAKENNFEIVFEGPKNGYIVKEKNGPNAIAPLSDFLYQMFGDDARAIDYYGAKAQLSFYENPEETINQYELQKMKSRAKDSEDYQKMVEERNKRQTFEKNKTVINTAENNTRSELHEVKDRRKTFQDYANEMGEAFNASPAKQAYDETLQEENVKQRTYENIKDLSDNVRNVSYFDEEGNPVAEDVIVGVVAQGMMISDISNSAKVIANNTYQQTVKGADPYTMARYNNQLQMSLANYKNELQKDLVLFKSDNELATSITGGKGKKGTLDLGKELTDDEEEKIRKKVKEELIKKEAGISDKEVELAQDAAVEKEKAIRKQEQDQYILDNIDAIERGVISGAVTGEQTNIINNRLQKIQVNEEGEAILQLAPTIPLTSYVPKGLTKEIKSLSPTEVLVASGANKGSVEMQYMTSDGVLEKYTLTVKDKVNAINNAFAENASIIWGNTQNIESNVNQVGAHIGNQITEGVSSKNPVVVAAANQVLRSRNIAVIPNDATRQIKAVKDAIKNNPKAFADYFLSDPRVDVATTRLFEKYQGTTELGNPENVKSIPYQPGTTENPFQPYNPYTITHVGKLLGVDPTAVTQLKVYKTFTDKQISLWKKYDNATKTVLDNGAKSRLKTAEQGTENEYEVIENSQGTYLGNKYPTKTQYIKVHDKYIEQTVPSDYAYQFSSFLKDSSKDGYKILKKFHQNKPEEVQAAGYAGLSYFVSAGEFKARLTEADIIKVDGTDAGSVLSVQNLVQLDKAGLLSVGNRTTPTAMSIFEKDEKGNVLRYSDDKGLPMLTQEAKDYGVYYENNQLVTDELLVSAFLGKNIIVPTLDQRHQQQFDIIEDLSAVRGYTSKGIYTGTAADNDFTFHSLGLITNTNLANYNQDEINNLRDGLDLGSRLFEAQPEGVDVFPGVGSYTQDVVQIEENGEYREVNGEDNTRKILEGYKNIVSLESSKEIDKLGTLDAPQITQTLITNSGIPGYGFLQLQYTGPASKAETLGVISDEQYMNLKAEDQTKVDNAGVTILPKTRVLIKHEDYTPFIKANQDIAFNTFVAGDKIGSLETFNSEIEITKITPDAITYNVKYNEYYRNPTTNKIEYTIAETTENKYNRTAGKDYIQTMMGFILTGQAMSDNSLKVANETKL
jgi:hypothetical protein